MELHIFSALILPSLWPAERSIIKIQDHIIQTRIACALERYWLKNGTYPETLSMLVPDFISKIPDDLLTGKPMIYRRSAPNKFLLYSEGWDRMDNGGVPVARGEASGDWVWGAPQY